MFIRAFSFRNPCGGGLAIPIGAGFGRRTERRALSRAKARACGTLLVFGGLLVTAEANPLYIQRVESAKVMTEAIAKAEQQIRDHKDVKIREGLKVPPFHKRLDDPVEGGEAFCQGCHLPLPHTEKLRTRAFLNLHSRYVACETCHFRPKGATFDYRWLDYLVKQTPPPGSRFRTGTRTDNATPLDGKFKIAPFLAGSPAIALPGSLFAEGVARAWKDSDESGKARLKARLHSPLEKQGPACAACHTEQKPMLDLINLGATPEQATAIQRHVIPQFFGRYPADDARLKIIDILR